MSSVSASRPRAIFELTRSLAERGFDFELWIMKADGKGRRRLSPSAPSYASPSWSTDEKKIAFTGRGVSVVNADGSGLRKLARGIFGTWSPGRQKTTK